MPGETTHHFPSIVFSPQWTSCCRSCCSCRPPVLGGTRFRIRRPRFRDGCRRRLRSSRRVLLRCSVGIRRHGHHDPLILLLLFLLLDPPSDPGRRRRRRDREEEDPFGRRDRIRDSNRNYRHLRDDSPKLAEEELSYGKARRREWGSESKCTVYQQYDFRKFYRSTNDREREIYIEGIGGGAPVMYVRR